MTRDEFAVLRLELVEATRLSFEACRRANADQTIYAYALVMCSGSGEALQPWCHSEESFAKKEAKWPGAADEAGLRKYHPDEWWSIVSGPVQTRAGWDFGNIQQACAAAYEQFGEEEPDIILELLIDTLESLDREGFFGTGKTREAVTLMICMSDSSAELWRDSVRRLNPRAVVKRFEAALP